MREWDKGDRQRMIAEEMGAKMRMRAEEEERRRGSGGRRVKRGGGRRRSSEFTPLNSVVWWRGN